MIKILHYLFEIPVIAVAVWGLYNAQTDENGIVISLWPLDSEIHARTALVLFCFLLYGFIWGRISSWFGYSSVRSDLRRQRKANRDLNREQEKLNETVSGLKQNIQGLMEQKVQKENIPAESGKSSFWQKIKTKVSAAKNSKSDGKGL